MTARDMKLQIFAPAASQALGEAVANALGHPLAPMEERDFEDGEHKARPLESVRGRDVYVIHSLYGAPANSANDKLCRMLFFIAALKTNGAARVTAVVPYMPYARKDRQTKPRDPLNARYVAQMFEAMGTDHVVTLETHNLAAFQNAYRCETLALDLRGVLLDRAEKLAGKTAVTVASPDPGGVKRAQLFREALEQRIERPVGFALMEKRRSAGVVKGSILAGDVAGARVLLIDDMIASGGTMLRAARALSKAGARDVWALAAHGLFTGTKTEVLNDPALAGWIVTDSVAPFRLHDTSAQDRVELISCAPLLARAIDCLHRDQPVTGLPAGGA